MGFKRHLLCLNVVFRVLLATNVLHILQVMHKYVSVNTGYVSAPI